MSTTKPLASDAAEERTFSSVWCFDAGWVPRGKHETGRLVVLPGAIEFQSAAGRPLMAPVIRVTSVTFGTGNQAFAALAIDHGDPVAHRLIVTNRFNFGYNELRLNRINAAIQKQIDQPALKITPLRETFLKPRLAAIVSRQVLQQQRLAFGPGCIACGEVSPHRLTISWTLDWSVPEVRIDQLSVPLDVPICLPCHQLGMLDAFDVRAIRLPHTTGSSAVAVELPNVVAYEPFRRANELPPESWLNDDRGHAVPKPPLDAAAASDAMRPGLADWRVVDSRFGLHRYLRIKDGLRQLSHRHAVTRHLSHTPEQIRAGIEELQVRENVSFDDLCEAARLMNEPVPALELPTG